VTLRNLPCPHIEAADPRPGEPLRHAPQTGVAALADASTAGLLTRQPDARHQPDPEVARANAAVADATICALVDRGVREVVVSPGSRNTPLILAIDLHPTLHAHVVVDERTAGFFALGLARASKAPVALVCTSGSAGTHYGPAVAEACHSRVPLVVLTADRPARLQHCGAPQTLDQCGLFASHVRARVNLDAPTIDAEPQAWYDRISELAASCMGTHPGPVHANLRFEKPLWSRQPRAPFVAIERARPPVQWPVRLDPEACCAVVSRLARVSRGVLVCGPNLGIDDPETALSEAVGKLARVLGWPVLVEPLAKFSCTCKYNDSTIHHADLLLRTPEFATAHAPDQVVRIGAMPTSKFVSQWLDAHGRGHTILIDEAGKWLDPTKGADTLIVGSPADVCTQLATALAEAGPRPRDSGFRDGWRQADQIAATCTQQTDCGWWEGAIARTIAATLAPGTTLHIGNSNAVRDLGSFANEQAGKLHVVGNRGVNGIDGNVATALGEAVGQTGPTVLVCGDLTLGHDLGTLLNEVAGRKINLTIVVINNGGGGIFRQLPIATHPTAFTRYFLAPRASVFGALCESSGIGYRQATNHTELRASLLRATKSPSGPVVIEAIVDGEHSEAQRKALLASLHTQLLVRTKFLPSISKESSS